MAMKSMFIIVRTKKVRTWPKRTILVMMAAVLTGA